MRRKICERQFNVSPSGNHHRLVLTLSIEWVTDLDQSDAMGSRLPIAQAPTELKNVYSGGTPILASIRQQVPQHGDGRLSHQTLSDDFFVFRFERTPDGYDIFIEQQRDYGGRACDAAATHRLGLSSDRPRICIWPGKEPRDLPTAIFLAMLWAERTSRYIRDGVPWS
ncbi:hypothetical protein ABIF65_009527 [Bradyrhizobium japonicum]